MLRFLCAALCVLVALGTATAQETPFQPIATVNDDVITAFDLDQRMRLLAASGAPTDDVAALRGAALDALIDDRLRLQAGERAGLEPTPEIVESGLTELARRSNSTPDEFRQALAERGVGDQAISDMVGAQVIWREVVQNQFSGRIEPGEAEIDAEIALADRGGDVSVRLSEIGLATGDQGRSEAETRALADRLYRELASGGDFAAAVQRYSRSSSRAQGGDVGWLRLADLPPDMAQILGTVGVGEVAPPIPVNAGYSLLRVTDRRVENAELDADDPGLRERVRQSLVERRLNRLSQGLLQELRRDALIEIRQ